MTGEVSLRWVYLYSAGKSVGCLSDDNIVGYLGVICSIKPVFNSQTMHPAKFPYVVCDHDQPISPGMDGNNHIVSISSFKTILSPAPGADCDLP